MFPPRYWGKRYYPAKYWGGAVVVPPVPPPIVIVSSGGGQTTYRKRNIFQERREAVSKLLRRMARLEQERIAHIQQDDEEILRILMDE